MARDMQFSRRMMESGIVPDDDQKLSPNHPTIKAMQESAHQLGLNIEVEES